MRDLQASTQALGTPVGTASPLDQATVLERIHNAHHGRAIEAYGFRQAPLRNTRVRFDQQHNADPTGRKLADLSSEITEYGLLGDAQAVADQLGQDTRLQFTARALQICRASWGFGAS